MAWAAFVDSGEPTTWALDVSPCSEVATSTNATTTATHPGRKHAPRTRAARPRNPLRDSSHHHSPHQLVPTTATVHYRTVTRTQIHPSHRPPTSFAGLVTHAWDNPDPHIGSCPVGQDRPSVDRERFVPHRTVTMMSVPASRRAFTARLVGTRRPRKPLPRLPAKRERQVMGRHDGIRARRRPQGDKPRPRAHRALTPVYLPHTAPAGTPDRSRRRG